MAEARFLQEKKMRIIKTKGINKKKRQTFLPGMIPKASFFNFFPKKSKIFAHEIIKI
jgi:hypothetical protein